MHMIISRLKVPFVSQEPIRIPNGTPSMYKADFLIMRALDVEVDGEVHEEGKNPIKDEHRDEVLKKLGLRVRRFTTEQVDDEPEACAKGILIEIEQLPVEVRVAAFQPAGTYWNMPNRGW